MLASCYLFRFTSQGGLTEEKNGSRDGPTWVVTSRGKVWGLDRTWPQGLHPSRRACRGHGYHYSAGQLCVLKLFSRSEQLPDWGCHPRMCLFQRLGRRRDKGYKDRGGRACEGAGGWNLKNRNKAMKARPEAWSGGHFKVSWGAYLLVNHPYTQRFMVFVILE